MELMLVPVNRCTSELHHCRLISPLHELYFRQYQDRFLQQVLTWSSVFQWNIFLSIFCPVCLGKKVTQGFDDHLTHDSFDAEIAEQEPVKVIESNKSFFGLIGCCLMEESVNIPKEVYLFSLCSNTTTKLVICIFYYFCQRVQGPWLQIA